MDGRFYQCDPVQQVAARICGLPFPDHSYFMAHGILFRGWLHLRPCSQDHQNVQPLSGRVCHEGHAYWYVLMHYLDRVMFAMPVFSYLQVSDGDGCPTNQTIVMRTCHSVYSCQGEGSSRLHLEAGNMSMEMRVQESATTLTFSCSAGLLYAASLWLSNSSYLYLSVSFIQMTKSLMPGLVYLSLIHI